MRIHVVTATCAKDVKRMSEEEQRQAVIKAVEEVLLQRSKHGALENEIDFLMGAGAAMQALGVWPIPPRWVFIPMHGDSLVEFLQKLNARDAEDYFVDNPDKCECALCQPELDDRHTKCEVWCWLRGADLPLEEE